MTYHVNEIFYSLQGEGARAGTANVFVRFAGCNLTCSVDGEAGFDCDTEFSSGARYGRNELLAAMNKAIGVSDAKACILTGGEPSLQVDGDLVSSLASDGWFVAIETNGTKELPVQDLFDWVCVSPKTAFHTIRQVAADEFKLVRHAGQELPLSVPCKPRLGSRGITRLVSPAFGAEGTSRETLEWCVDLVKKNPHWRLSCQQHKWWGVR
jgi:organic radical activating enzyme